MTKETLHLVDVLLERVRSTLLSSLLHGAEITGKVDIGGDADIEEKINELLQPAVQAVACALRVAEFARVVPGEFLLDDILYFTSEDGEVRLAPFDELERAWRPVPPGPAYKIESLPPENVEIPDLVDPNAGGPIQ